MADSALFGHPPANTDDYYIVKYLYESAGLTKFNASKGFPASPPRPTGSQYVFQTRRVPILIGLSFCIFLMVAVTGLRLYVRVFNKKLKTGMDDALIVPGVVGFRAIREFGAQR
jgi:hypothetical protein